MEFNDQTGDVAVAQLALRSSVHMTAELEKFPPANLLLHMYLQWGIARRFALERVP
jgi:hypothetical protein